MDPSKAGRKIGVILQLEFRAWEQQLMNMKNNFIYASNKVLKKIP